MNDNNKDKGQLIKELTELRQRVAELEALSTHHLESSLENGSAAQTPFPEFMGQEVSCRAIGPLFAELQKTGLPPDTLSAGVDYSLEHLLDKHKRIDWSSFRTIMANASNIWSDQELVTIGGAILRSPWLRPVAVVARLLFTATDFYRWSAKPGPVNSRAYTFSCIVPSLQELGSNRLEYTIRMQSGYEPCRLFFLVTKGFMAAMPTALGLKPAKVAMEEIEGGARYIIQVPSGGGALVWLRKTITAPFTARTVGQELKEAYETLQSRYLELGAQIAERKRAEATLRESEERYRNLVEFSPVPIFVYCEGRFSYLNPAAVKLHGASRTNELIGKPLMDFVHPNQSRSLEKQMQKAIDDPNQVRHSETQIVRLDGQVIDIAATTMGVTYADEPAWLVICQDVTERKRAEEALRSHSERLEEIVRVRTGELQAAHERLLRQEKLATIGQMSASIAHELRNPLGAIKQSGFYLQRLYKRGSLNPDNPKVKEHLDVIDGEIETADQVISNLLDMTRMQPPKQIQVDLEKTIREAVGSAALPEQVQIKFDFKPDPFLIWADPGQIRQVFINLLVNAGQACSESGQVIISARLLPDCEQARIELQDSGRGIGADTIDKVFEPLYTTKAKGTGLGLSICKQIIDAHGGKITLSSQVDQGTTVQILLPHGPHKVAPEQGDAK